MHRASLRALIAALALVTAALAVPQGNAALGGGGTNPATRSAASPTARFDLARYARPVRACRSGLVALTFDDGPSASVTRGLIRTLLRLEVPATFFMVGSRVHANPEIARQVQRAGFQVANHSWSHPQLTALSDRSIRGELVRTRREFRAHRIRATWLMRPPFGATNQRVRRDVRGLGLIPVLWSIDSRDWTGGSPRQIADRVLGALRRNQTNLVLQHDGVANSPNSAKAVPLIVAGARKRGYCFAALGPRGRVADPVPVVRASAIPGTEDGPVPLRIKLVLDRPTTRSVSVRVRTLSRTAESGSDFRPVATRVRFPRGVQTAWLVVPVIDDSLVEPNEDLAIVLDQPRGVSVLRPEVFGTIFSDDPQTAVAGPPTAALAALTVFAPTPNGATPRADRGRD